MQSLPSSTDILIVGAGPSGLALAAELRRQGASALLIDRQTEGANTSRAAVVHARTLEVLEPLGATEALLGIGLIVPTFQVRDRDNLLLSVDFADLPTRYPYALLCPQNKTEAVLLDRLHSLGGEVVRPVDVSTVRQGPLGAAVDMTIDGSTRTIETKWLIGCDGMNSIVREQSGIGFAGAAYPQDFVLADVRMDWPLPRDEVDLFLSPDGLMVVAPLPDDRFRVVATVTHAPEHPTIDAIEAILRQRGPSTSSAIRVHDLIWSSRFRVHHRISDMPRKGRVLLCGDAAHVHSPAGGQGMNTGIQDAVALAVPLIEAVRSGDDGGLDAWAKARHAIAEDVVKTTDRITQVGLLRSGPAQAVRNTAFSLLGHIPAATSALARKIAEIDNR
ncbi:FAD-dependent monooxygenase [Lichenihabitans sp. PAMC28606]|uniref:FAD-dependent monooxygenase n=1 Tax=Lichenihabitans sp. PAMC28606 TaxID=2880932 RepID=UPI001D0B91C2|nr:NAD(P)/FAD-dependent oxidoreductase [Lichenihabitans sp. PAMC28606]UDL94455.1 FAD-dependent monooxygenase [Lichenihabitans sp. PAMC28606]